MGQKVHPNGFRLGYNRTWRSRWYPSSKTSYAEWIAEDLAIKKAIKGRFPKANISRVEVERHPQRVQVDIHTSRPGIVIGKKGAEVDKLRDELKKRTGKDVFVNIEEIHKPEVDAQLVAENIAAQLENRVSFRRAMKKALDISMQFGALGIRIRCAGRLNGAEIARSEWYLRGQLPLHTLRMNIDYGQAEANTTFGIIGVKVWINRGEQLPEKKPSRDFA